MTKHDWWVALIYCGVVCIGLPYQLWSDFHHPENWISGTANDPHIYGWVFVALWLSLVYIGISIFRIERKIKRRARLAALMIRAKELLRQRRTDEAGTILEECKRLLPR